jgi:hypothetical protein
MTGTSPVHDRSMTGSTRSSPCEGIPGNPCGLTPPLAQRPDPRAASLATAPCQSSTGRRATRTRSPPPWQPGWDGAGPMWKPAPGAGTNKTSPPSVASRTAENRPPGMRGMHQSGEQSGGPRNGTKRARIGKASGSTNRSFGPDAVRYMSVTIATPCPAAAHDDTRRDKKETARRAAFPQRAGRFRRWWQVLGSNQRRLSRRFYRPLPLATRATCRVPQRWRGIQKDSPQRDHTVSGIPSCGRAQVMAHSVVVIDSVTLGTCRV